MPRFNRKRNLRFYKEQLELLYSGIEIDASVIVKNIQVYLGITEEERKKIMEKYQDLEEKNKNDSVRIIAKVS